MRSWALVALVGAHLAAIDAETGEALGKASGGSPVAASAISSANGQPVAPQSGRFAGFPFAFGSPLTILVPGPSAELKAGKEPIEVERTTPSVAVNTGPRIETTPEGVIIVRGTGSRHVRH